MQSAIEDLRRQLDALKVDRTDGPLAERVDSPKKVGEGPMPEGFLADETDAERKKRKLQVPAS